MDGRKLRVLLATADVSCKDVTPQFRRYTRRLNRGPSLQGSVAIMVLLPIPATLGVGCMVTFIVVMARPPHAFTPAAQGFACGISALLYRVCSLGNRMGLASFGSDWVERENTGWWGRYVRMKRCLGRVEHSVYTRVKDGLNSLRRLLVRDPSTHEVGPGLTERAVVSLRKDALQNTGE
jgi:hypothetical protein